jgi:copper oxidase (laccase) domain-containing protein
VGAEVASQFPAGFVDYSSYKKPHVNLKAFLNAELISAGVLENNIEVSNDCTLHDQKFYSYRRERDKAGRMLACMYMNKTKEVYCE